MIPEVPQNHENDILHISRLVLDHIQFFGAQLKNFVPDIVVVIEISIRIGLHQVQDTMNFNTNEETTDLFTILLSEVIAIVLSLDPTVEIGQTLENTIPLFDIHQDHVLDLSLHLEDFSIK